MARNSYFDKKNNIMKGNIELTETSSPNFHSNGKAFLVYCPECEMENYAMNVVTGICTFCRYDLNKTKVIKDEVKET